MNVPATIPSDRWQDGGNWLEFLPPSDFSFRECLAFMARSSLECLHQVQGDKLYKLVDADGQRVLILASCLSGNLRVEFPLGEPGTQAKQTIAQYIWELFDLGRDLSPFYQLAGGDSLLRGVVAKYRGLRIVGMPDLFEALTWAIIGQQINLAFAYTLKRRFVERFGEARQYEDTSYWLYPTPEIISEVSISDLTNLQFTGKKAEYIIGIAQTMTSGALSKEALQETGCSQEIRRRLIALRGVGEWTADYVLMKCFRETSAFPVADVGLHNAVKKQLGVTAKPTMEEIRQLARSWTGWEAYATFYLWRSLYD